MISLASVYARCLKLLGDMPEPHCYFRPKNGPADLPPDVEEMLETLHQLDVQNRDRIDALIRTLVLDWIPVEETETTWFLIQQRVLAALFVIERLQATLAPDDAYLPKDYPEDALEWALVRLWRFAGPVWSHRAARLLVAGKDLSSRDSP
jgi:hypothetical protein